MAMSLPVSPMTQIRDKGILIASPDIYRRIFKE